MHIYLPSTMIFPSQSYSDSCLLSWLPLELVGRGTGDVEPLVDAGVDGSGRLVLALGNVERAGVGAVGRVRDGGVGPTSLLVQVV
jgi:hypothetical protein